METVWNKLDCVCSVKYPYPSNAPITSLQSQHPSAETEKKKVKWSTTKMQGTFNLFIDSLWLQPESHADWPISIVVYYRLPIGGTVIAWTIHWICVLKSLILLSPHLCPIVCPFSFLDLFYFQCLFLIIFLISLKCHDYFSDYSSLQLQHSQFFCSLLLLFVLPPSCSLSP